MAEYVNPRAQACQNCVKAKAKCYGHSNGRCERCGLVPWLLSYQGVLTRSIMQMRSFKQRLSHARTNYTNTKVEKDNVRVTSRLKHEALA